jgi:hypothetical protein
LAKQTSLALGNGADNASAGANAAGDRPVRKIGLVKEAADFQDHF